ncbi:MAG: MBL fold metallo-hydrolase [Chloroflexi bacterium]|nr:MBL fold metallo-hydrolase [Chloroflexota bacterium]
MAQHVDFTVLGASPAAPSPGGACSGYVLRAEGMRILLDCGSGALANLALHGGYDGLSAIVISHMHADHILDLIPFRYLLKYGPRDRPDFEPPHIPLYLPPGGRAVLEGVVRPILALAGGFEAPERFFADVFAVSEYDPEAELPIGTLTLRFVAVEHYVPTWAIVVDGTRRFAYSADSGPCPALVTVARDADLFLCEATLAPSAAPPGWRGHITAQEAAEAARAGGARRLVLTHLWRTDPEAALVEARAAFDGPIDLAQEHRTYVV